MKQSCTSTVRRSAAIGAAVAIVAASSAFGIGATAAVADTPADTSVVQPGGATTVTTSASADETVTDESPTPVPTSTPVAETPAATPAAATPTAAEPDASLAFPEGTSADAPLVLTATAGDALSRTFTASGGSEPVMYALRGERGKPIVGDGSFDNDFHLDGTTGVLSGTARLATQYRFQVVATSGDQTATEYVELTVSPGKPVGVTFSAASSDDVGLWQVETDGTIWEQAVGQGRVKIVPDIPVRTGTSLTLAGLAVDAYGNRTTGSDADDEYPRSTATSTVASDRIVWDDLGKSNTVTFTTGGTRTITVSEGGVSTSFTAVATDAPFAFQDGSSTAKPIAIRPTAGEEFVRAFPVTGAPDPAGIRYELRGSRGEPIDGTDARNGLDVTIDPDTGVLTGTGTAASSFRFQVVATSGGREAVAHVELTVSPAAFDRFAVAVLSTDRDPDGESWGVDGDTITHFSPNGDEERVDAIPARQGDRKLILAVPVDQYGNAVADHDALTITSDVASDEITDDPDTAGTWVTFEHASPHVVTVAYDGHSQAIPFEVQASATAASVTKPAAGSGTLAYTGADESGPLAWALGLLAAGGGLLLHRLRRRRA